MSHDPLRQLLREADAAAGEPPTFADDLARRVRVLAARRQRMNFRYSAAAALMLAAGLTVLFSQTTTPRRSDSRSRIGGPTRLASSEIEQLRAEIERTNRETEMRLAIAVRTAELLKEMKRVEAAKQRRQELPDAVANARREVEQAAFALVSNADRMCREMDLCESAAEKYRRVVELFPDSRWAVVARERLDALKNRGEIS